MRKLSCRSYRLKTYIGSAFLLRLRVAGVWSVLAAHAWAQSFTVLHSFTATSGPSPNYTNGDGAGPIAGLILSGNTLYGAAQNGGGAGFGTIFRVNTDGTGFTNLYSFSGGSDGGDPAASLILADNILYGTAEDGGSPFGGTVFRLNTDGTGFTNLHSFAYASDGGYPVAGLILSGSTLYGTAIGGGSSGNGTVFRLNTDGTGFTNLHSFTATSGPAPNYTNADGAKPVAGLILSGETLYGTTEDGGGSGNGTVFAISTDGTGFANLHSFTALAASFSRTNSDGAKPAARLVLSGKTLYGTAHSGGSSGNGTVFAVSTDGTGFTNLHSFTATSGSSGTNSDGTWPNAGLILAGNTLYGTAAGGGSSGMGAVFAINTDGTGFTNLHSFGSTGSDGALPYGEMALSGNTLYGTTFNGGSSFYGTVFSLSLEPQMTITRSAATIVVTWPTNYAGSDYTGYKLQSTLNLVSPVWDAVSTAPVVINGQNTVTIPISVTQQFFRLSQ